MTHEIESDPWTKDGFLEIYEGWPAQLIQRIRLPAEYRVEPVHL